MTSECDYNTCRTTKDGRQSKQKLTSNFYMAVNVTNSGLGKSIMQNFGMRNI